MRKKLINKIKLITAVFYGLIFGLLLCIYLFRDKIGDFKWIFIIVSCLLVLAGNYFINKYDDELDKSYIEKMVKENKIALARIDKAEMGNLITIPFKARYVLWQLNVTIFNEDGSSKKAVIVDQFAGSQINMPNGYIYVTYDGKEDSMLVVPMGLIAMFPINQEKVMTYEKNIAGLKYLNVYYNKGICIETYEQTTKRQAQETK